MDKEKRMSFHFHDIAHIYEMIVEHMCLDVQCGQCELLNKRFKKFLGEKEVKAVEKIIRKNGYCNRLKGKKL